MKSINLLLFFILSPTPSAWSTTSAKEIKISVKFDQSFYKLEYDNGLFSYQDGPISYRAKLSECNRSEITKVSDQYKKLFNAYSSAGDRKTSEFDVEIVANDGKSLKVARGSEFGTWLRELPKKMMYFNAEVKASCKR